jgi:hypothetical protein
MITLSTSAYGNNSLFSDPMIIHMPKSANSNNFIITMQTNNKSIYSINDINETVHYVETICVKDAVGPVSVSGCPNAPLGDILVYCNGTAATITTQCPQYEVKPFCTILNFAPDTVCHTISHSDTNVTCHCTSSSVKSQLTFDTSRELVEEDGDSASGGKSRIEFSTMTRSVASDFVQTWLSADNLTPGDVIQSWKVLSTICGIFALVTLALAFSIYADKSVSINPEKDKMSIMQTKKLTKPMTSKMIRHISAEMQMIEETLPVAFRTASFVEKLAHELKKYHRWLGIWFYYSPNFPRVLRVISLSTTVIATLFIQAVTYNIAEVDDGSCESYVDLSSCLSELSTLDRNANKCYWDADTEQCHYLEPADDLLRVVFVAIISALWSAPIAIGANWLIMNVLAAKTLDVVAANFKLHSVVVDRSHMDNKASIRSTHKQVFVQSVNNEVRELNDAVIQYKQILSEAEQREYAGIIYIILILNLLIYYACM